MSTSRKTIKVINHGDGPVSFTCPGCTVEKKVSLKRLAGRHVVKVKCSCQNRFNLEINYRNRARRNVDIPAYWEKSAGEGPITIGTTSLSPLKEFKNEPKENNCRVVDLSKAGIAIKTDCGFDIVKGDIIKVLFNLDDIAETEIYQDYKVMNVIPKRFGCSIIGTNIHLDFYSPISR